MWSTVRARSYYQLAPAKPSKIPYGPCFFRRQYPPTEEGIAESGLVKQGWCWGHRKDAPGATVLEGLVVMVGLSSSRVLAASIAF